VSPWDSINSFYAWNTRLFYFSLIIPLKRNVGKYIAVVSIRLRFLYWIFESLNNVCGNCYHVHANKYSYKFYFVQLIITRPQTCEIFVVSGYCPSLFSVLKWHEMFKFGLMCVSVESEIRINLQCEHFV
jgi:hypothetical protein